FFEYDYSVGPVGTFTQVSGPTGTTDNIRPQDSCPYQKIRPRPWLALSTAAGSRQTRSGDPHFKGRAKSCSAFLSPALRQLRAQRSSDNPTFHSSTDVRWTVPDFLNSMISRVSL